ncbi:hypothetical protein PR048_016550 [Dryococelus australis]|uniref:Uncharacterized protein n=1 Tax=Dryococelus australis TaxID=614101 RepID=A0ABQ9HKC5_9NEOP|nr:hypothetical protein PR048_016550 [Dryococelus australis]
MNLENREQIQERTRKQNSSHEWKVECSKRITSSKLGTKSSREILVQIRASKESVAIAQFERENPRIEIKRRASPDGLIGNDQIIEVNCPSSVICMPPLDALAKGKIKYLEMKDGKRQFKLSHNYMYQCTGSPPYFTAEHVQFRCMDSRRHSITENSTR